MSSLPRASKQDKTGLSGMEVLGPHLAHRNLSWSQLWYTPIKPAISDSFHPKCARADFPFKIMEVETASRNVSRLIFKKMLQSTTLAFSMRR